MNLTEEQKKENKRLLSFEKPFWYDDISVFEWEMENVYFHGHWELFKKKQYVPIWKQKDTQATKLMDEWMNAIKDCTENEEVTDFDKYFKLEELFKKRFVKCK